MAQLEANSKVNLVKFQLLFPGVTVSCSVILALAFRYKTERKQQNSVSGGSRLSEQTKLSKNLLILSKFRIKHAE